VADTARSTPSPSDSRNGRAIRLSYDHKGTDAKEIERIEAAGGYVMNQRVNGYLAVTRSLGDSQMKQFVVGSPYTTETTLRPDDDFLIVACDGVRRAVFLRSFVSSRGLSAWRRPRRSA